MTVDYNPMFEVIKIHLDEHDAICDLMVEVLGHSSLTILEDLYFRTHGRDAHLYSEVDLDNARDQIPDSRVLLATLTEDEALTLAWDLIQSVKAMRNHFVERLKLVK